MTFLCTTTTFPNSFEFKKKNPTHFEVSNTSNNDNQKINETNYGSIVFILDPTYYLYETIMLQQIDDSFFENKYDDDDTDNTTHF